MSFTCMVRGCRSRSGQEGLNFFYLPSCRDENNRLDPLKQKKLLAWLKAIKIDMTKLETNKLKNHRVCSLHFVSGQPSNEMYNVDWAPTLNLDFAKKKKSFKDPIEVPSPTPVEVPRDSPPLKTQFSVETNTTNSNSEAEHVQIKCEFEEPPEPDFDEEPDFNFPLDEKISFVQYSTYEKVLSENESLKTKVQQLEAMVQDLHREAVVSKKRILKLEQMLRGIKTIVDNEFTGGKS